MIRHPSKRYRISSGSLAPNQEITAIELTGAGTTVDEYSIEITEDSVVIGENTANYAISLEPGTLTISQNTAEIVVKPASGSKTYDGTALTKTAHDDFTVTGVPEGFTWTATADGTVTNVTPGEGEKAENAVTAFQIFNAEGEDVTDQFANIDTSAKGMLTINPIAVTVKAVNKSKDYDNDPTTDPALTVEEIENVVEGESINYSLSRVAGQEAGNYAISVTAGSNPNYTVSVAGATFTINKINTLEVSLDDDAYDYDGTAHANAKVATTNALSGETTIEYSKAVAEGEEAKWTTDLSSLTATNVADSMTINVRATNPNYSNEATDTATLTINPIAVTVKAENKSKDYDNDPTTDPALTVEEIEGVVEGESINYSLSRVTGQEAGSYAISVTAGSNPNYTVSVEGATFTINKINTLEVALDDDAYDYDGTAHANADKAFYEYCYNG